MRDPSEIAITQDTHRIVRIDDLAPPEKLSPDYMVATLVINMARLMLIVKSFLDGRVGSHSGLAKLNMAKNC